DRLGPDVNGSRPLAFCGESGRYRGMPIVADLPNVQAFRAMQEQSRLLEQVQVAFIVGPPGCGTSWVRDTLNGHPEAVALGEGHLATGLLTRITAAVQGYNSEQNGRAKQSQQPISSSLQLDDGDTFLLARQAIDRILIRYLRAAGQAGKTRIRAVMDKTP